MTAPGGESRSGRSGPLLVVLGGVFAGIGAVYLHHFRLGCLMIGLFALLGAGLRLGLRDSGMLVVRSRVFDVAFLAVLGLVVTGLTLLIPTS